MKEKVLAVILLIFIFAGVTVNTLFLDRQNTGIINALSELDLSAVDAKANAESIYGDFKKSKVLMSLTICHEEITRIEECFIELIDSLKTGETDEAEKTNNRLKYYLEHLRRLSGFNIDSII